MPASPLIGLVALVRISRSSAEEAEVSRSVRRLVLIVSHAGIGPDLVSPPRRIVAVVELGGDAGGVGVVASSEHGARDTVQQPGGGLVPLGGAVGYVPAPTNIELRVPFGGRPSDGCPSGSALPEEEALRPVASVGVEPVTVEASDP